MLILQNVSGNKCSFPNRHLTEGETTTANAGTGKMFIEIFHLRKYNGQGKSIANNKQITANRKLITFQGKYIANANIFDFLLLNSSHCLDESLIHRRKR